MEQGPESSRPIHRENSGAAGRSFVLFDELNRRIAKHRLLAGAAVAAVTFFFFSGSLATGFVYDDNPQILQNAFILNSHLWKQIFTGSVWSFQGGKTNFYRPLQFACYWILYRIGGPNPAVFHLLNLLLYALSAWLVYRLSQMLFKSDVVAFAGALLWALHPVHVEAVAWISALPDVGFAFFTLLAFVWFLCAGQDGGKLHQYHALASLSFFVALFFKEMALSFPFLLLAYWFFLGRPESWFRRVLSWLPYLAAMVVYVAVRCKMLGYMTQGGHLWRISPRVAGADLGLLGQDTKILFWPVHLNVFRMFYLGQSLRSPWPWITLLCLGGTLWLRKREPLLAFLIAWWPVTLLPVLDIRQLSFPLLADRFLYFPSIGPCLAVAYLLLDWLPRRALQTRLAPAAVCTLSLVVFFCAVQTVRAIPRWRDNNTLIHYSLTQSPDSPLLHMARGVVLEYERGDLKEALKEYNIARRLNQKSSWPLNLDHDYYLAVGRILLRTGNKQEAIEDFKKAQSAAPDSSQPSDALGAVFFPQGDYATAAEYFERSVEANPQDVTAHFYLGTCWMKLGKYHQAAGEFHHAREVVPDYWQAYQAEANALEAAGQSTAAEKVRAEIENRQHTQRASPSSLSK
jgi:protein O-mannosyl-transferase